MVIYLDTLYQKPYLTRREMADPYRKVGYGGHKIFSDGSLGSRSAKLLAPYTDAPETDGILVQTQEELNEKMLRAYEMGLQPATHCIGDKGLDCVLTAIEYTLEKSREHGMTAREQADRDPFRIIHAQMATDEMIERMKKLPVVLDLQPVFLETDMHWVSQRIGEEPRGLQLPLEHVSEGGTRAHGRLGQPRGAVLPVDQHLFRRCAQGL